MDVTEENCRELWKICVQYKEWCATPGNVKAPCGMTHYPGRDWQSALLTKAPLPHEALSHDFSIQVTDNTDSVCKSVQFHMSFLTVACSSTWATKMHLSHCCGDIASTTQHLPISISRINRDNLPVAIILTLLCQHCLYPRMALYTLDLK